jgi:FeS assembly SUF system protein
MIWLAVVLEATRDGSMDATPEQPDLEQKLADADKVQSLEEQVIAALKTCFDPEVPVNIYELGLIYNIEIDLSGSVTIKMTLTSPMCPVAETLPPEVQRKVQAIPGVTSAKVDIVWEPIWTMERMSEAARIQLGLDY